MNIGIVHGYGVVDMSQKFYQDYLAGIKKTIEEYSIDCIIFSGGYTSKDYAHLSEAASMSQVLETNAIKYLEEDSFTTIDNVINCALLLKKLSKPISSIHTIASNIHIPKIIPLTLQYYGVLLGNDYNQLSQYQILYNFATQHRDILCNYHYTHQSFHYHGIDLSWSDTGLANQITSGILETGFNLYPELRQQFIMDRKKARGIL